MIVGFLAILSLSALGPATNFLYLTSVLPAHALSEVPRISVQYGSASLLYQLGLDRITSLRIGELAYLGTLGISVWLALRTATQLKNPSYLVLLPAALGMIGGTFAHRHDLAVILPLSLVLLSDVPKLRLLLVPAIAFLTITPELLASTYLHGLVDPIAVLVNPNIAFGASHANDLAQVPWTRYVDVVSDAERSIVPHLLLMRIPTYIAEFAIVLAIIFSSYSSRLDARSGLARVEP